MTLPTIVVVALVVRIVAVAAQPVLSTTDDAEQYERLALSLLMGRGYSYAAGVPSVERAPGYSFFLAGLFALVGHHTVAAQVASALFGALSVALAAWTARIVGGGGAAQGAAVLTALDPYLVQSSTQILSEPLFAAVLGGAVVLSLSAVRRDDLRLWAAAGFLIGLSSLVRPAGLVVGVALILGAVALAPTRSRRIMLGLVLSAAIAAPIAPWSIRNYAVLGEFVPIATAYRGLNLWTGALAATDGAWLGAGAMEPHMAPVLARLPPLSPELDERRRAELARQRQAGVTPEADRAFTEAAVEMVKADPPGYVRLYFLNLTRTWLAPEGAWGLAQRVGGDRSARWLVWALVGLPQILLVGLTAALGLWRVRDDPAARLLALMLITYAAVHSLAPGDLRLRVPVLPMVFVFCGLGADQVLHRWRRSERRPGTG